jgi:hypothetical protein
VGARRDDLPDLVVANDMDDTASVFLASTPGVFGAAQLIPTATQPYSIALGDLDADGNTDLAIAQVVAGTLGVVKGNDAGGFEARVDYPTGTVTEPWHVVLLDADHDHHLDAVVANNYSTSTLGLLAGTGDGTLAAVQDIPASYNPWEIDVADLDADGALDLVVPNGDTGGISVYRGLPDGTFAPRQTFATGPTPLAAAIGDLDGNGRPNLVTADGTGATVTVLLNTCQ